MALIKCPECGMEVSDKAKSCPHCGLILKNRKKLQIILFIVFIVLIVIGIILCNKNLNQNIPETVPSMNSQNTVNPLKRIELNNSNILNYIDCNISCEDFKQDNTQKDFLGFTNYYYSANAHINIFPKKGEKFENVQIELKYNYDNDLYEALYYSLGTVTINLNQDGVGEVKQSMHCSLSVPHRASPTMKNENIEIINVSGCVYDDEDNVNDLYNEGEGTVIGVIRRVRWENLNTSYILKIDSPISFKTQNKLYTNIDEIQIWTSDIEEKYIGNHVKITGHIRSGMGTACYIRDIVIEDPKIEIINTEQQDTFSNNNARTSKSNDTTVYNSDYTDVSSSVNYKKIKEGALNFAQDFFNEKFVLLDGEPDYGDGIYWIRLNWDDGTPACDVTYNSQTGVYGIHQSCDYLLDKMSKK